MVALAPLLAPLLVLASSTADEQVLATLLAQVAARAPDCDVVSRREVTQLLELEGNRQSIGCDTTTEACAAEIAAALGAELVVRAELSTLEGERVLALTVLHTRELARTQRALLRGATVAALGAQLEAELPALIAAARGPGSARIFVGDVTTLARDAGDDDALAWQWPVGASILGAGVIGLAAAGVAEVVVAGWQDDLERDGVDRLDQPAAVVVGQQRDQLAVVGQVAWVVGAVGVGGGVVVLATLLLEE